MLKKSLREVLSDDELSKVYGGFDVIGDIAIIKIPDSLLIKKNLIAKTILKNVKSVSTVLRQKSPVMGEYRVRETEFLAGEDKTVTIHKEYGCNFRIDVSKVFFSPRLSTERMRIVQQTNQYENIINMFAGVGVFSILIAKKNPTCKVYNIELNPEAHQYSVLNVNMNKVHDRVHTIIGDAKTIIEKSFKNSANRILMPLPEKAHEYLDTSIEALKPEGGVIHYYTHLHADSNEDPLKKAEIEIAKKVNEDFTILNTRIVREIGPRWNQIAIDLNIHKKLK
jgi:tRNA (guanine37-N1)-methyltransferase